MARFLIFTYGAATALLRPMAPPRRLHSIAPAPAVAALPALPALLARKASVVLTGAATNDEIAEPPNEKQEPVWKKFGEAGVIAYVGINVFWYAIGVNLFLRGMPIKQAGGATVRASMLADCPTHDDQDVRAAIHDGMDTLRQLAETQDD